MDRIVASIRMELCSDTIFSSGNSSPGGADITLRANVLGQPYVPGATLKGLLREAMGNYLVWTGSGTQADLDQLLGSSGIRAAESDRRLVFGDLYLEQAELTEEDRSYLRTFTKLKDGVVDHGTLHSALCLRRGLSLSGKLICAKDDAVLVEKSLRLIQSVGLKRNRGFGQVRLSFQELDTVRPCRAVEESNWLRYRLRLQSPAAITRGTNAPTDADRKNYSDSLDHIPGSAIRGLVMSHLSKADPEWFAAHKDALLRRVLFHSALPLIDGQPQIPTPMGFYESRDHKDFYHVLNQDVTSGHKRARLGRYCRFDGTKLLHSSPAMESSLRITVTDPDTRLPLDGKARQMFTTEALAADTVLEGSIYIPDAALTPRIAQAFRNWMTIGADRFGGSGLCSVELLDDQAPDRSAFGYRDGDRIPETVCLMILSPTALMEEGEVSGFTDEALAKLLGVPQARIERCATSILRHSGFNRTWGCASAIVSMYAPGSVFRIRCSEAPTLERLRELERGGVGIRRAEGCGQVLFLRDFFQIDRHAKSAVSHAAQSSSEQIQRRQARCQWLLKNTIQGDLSPSQQGTLQQLCEGILNGKLPRSALDEFFRGQLSRRTGFARAYAAANDQLDTILRTPLHKTLGCAPFRDTEMDRLALFCELFDMTRKGAKR